jgi:hypothetical protein
VLAREGYGFDGLDLESIVEAPMPRFVTIDLNARKKPFGCEPLGNFAGLDNVARICTVRGRDEF